MSVFCSLFRTENPFFIHKRKNGFLVVSSPHPIICWLNSVLALFIHSIFLTLYISPWVFDFMVLSTSQQDRPPARWRSFSFFFSAVFCSLRTRTYFLFPTHNQNLHRSTWFNQLLICSRTCIYTKHDMIYQCQHISKSYNICTKFIYSFRITRIQKPGERERER